MKDTLKDVVETIGKAIESVAALTNPKTDVAATKRALFVQLARIERALNEFIAAKESSNLSQARGYIKTTGDCLESQELDAFDKAHEALESARRCVWSEVSEESIDGPS